MEVERYCLPSSKEWRNLPFMEVGTFGRHLTRTKRQRSANTIPSIKGTHVAHADECDSEDKERIVRIIKRA